MRTNRLVFTLAALLPWAIATACSQFSSVDDPVLSADGGNGVDASATDGAATPEASDGSVVAPDTGPSRSCLLANDAGNVRITTVPPTPTINTPIEVDVVYAFTGGAAPTNTLDVCTPAGALETMNATHVSTEPAMRTAVFKLEAGIATAGPTQLHFTAGPTPFYEGTSTITVTP